MGEHKLCRLSPFFVVLCLSVASSLSASCILPLEELGAPDPLALTIEYNDDEAPYQPGIKWDRARFERRARFLEPVEGNVIIHRGLFRKYEEATGIKIDVQPGLELPGFLESRGIAPGDLTFLKGGLQGQLYTHPKLGNWLIKITSDVTDSSGLRSASAVSRVSLGQGRHSIGDLHKAYAETEAMRATIVPEHLPILERQLEYLKTAYRGQAKQALHRSHQMILPALIESQAVVPYLNFARIGLIGNGFFLREYYPDSQVGKVFPLAKELLAQDGKDLDFFKDAIHAIHERQPVLAEFYSMLIATVPSYFISRTLFESTPTSSRRLFVIYDMD